MPVLKTYLGGQWVDVGGGAGGLTNPMTTAGDIIYGGVSGAPTRLAKGTDGQVLTLASGLPAWAAASGGVSIQQTTVSLMQNASANITGISVIGVMGGKTKMTISDGNIISSGDYVGWGKTNVNDSSTVISPSDAWAAYTAGADTYIGVSGLVSPISRLRIFTADANNLTSLAVEYSTNGTDWTTIQTTTLPSTGDEWNNIPVAAYNAGGTHSIRCRAVTIDSGAYFTVGELELYGYTPYILGTDYTVTKTNVTGNTTITVTNLNAAVTTLLIDYI